MESQERFPEKQKAVKVIQRHAKRYFALKRLQEESNLRLKSDTSLEECFDETFSEETLR